MLLSNYAKYVITIMGLDKIYDQKWDKLLSSDICLKIKDRDER